MADAFYQAVAMLREDIERELDIVHDYGFAPV